MTVGVITGNIHIWNEVDVAAEMGVLGLADILPANVAHDPAAGGARHLVAAYGWGVVCGQSWRRLRDNKCQDRRPRDVDYSPCISGPAFPSLLQHERGMTAIGHTIRLVELARAPRACTDQCAGHLLLNVQSKPVRRPFQEQIGRVVAWQRRMVLERGVMYRGGHVACKCSGEGGQSAPWQLR